MTNFRLFAEWLILLAVAVALVLVAQKRDLTERLDLWVLDTVLSIRDAPTDPSIMIVEIDERSLDTLGTWPWNRDLHAALIDKLSAGGARAIGVDVLFLEPGDAASDEALALAITRSGRVILPHSFTADPQSRELAPVLPIPPLRAASAGIGHVAVAPDSDGTLRGFDLAVEVGQKSYPHFTAVIADHIASERPVPGERKVIVPFRKAASFQTISASEVIEDATPAPLIRDRIVLVGATAQGLGDRYSVPGYAGSLMSGVETQANLLSAILAGTLISEVSPLWATTIQLLAVGGLFVVFWQSTPRVALVVAVALAGVLALGSAAWLLLFQEWLAIGPAILAIIVAYPLWGWRRLASVSRFLDAEIATLKTSTSKRRVAASGFDHVARQVDRLRNITDDISNNLRFVQDVIEASPDAMLVLGASGSVDMANESARALFGADVAERATDLAGLLSAPGCTFLEDQDELVLADGRSFLLARAPIDHAVGSQVLVLRDISTIRADEQQRRETLEFLSHDMRSPQVAIIGLTTKSGGSLGDEERLARIENQARRTLKLTDDFVQIARLSSEGIVKEETDINSVIAEAVDRAFPLANRKGVRLVAREVEQLAYAQVDPSALARLLDNLLDNAIKFSPGGTTVLVALESSNSEHFVISVEDEGPGLPTERIKDPFARFGARSDGAGPSSGLGLAYVKQVVDKHHGMIDVETAPGGGTVFRLTIPAG